MPILASRYNASVWLFLHGSQRWWGTWSRWENAQIAGPLQPVVLGVRVPAPHSVTFLHGFRNKDALELMKSLLRVLLLPNWNDGTSSLFVQIYSRKSITLVWIFFIKFARSPAWGYSPGGECLLSVHKALEVSPWCLWEKMERKFSGSALACHRADQTGKSGNIFILAIPRSPFLGETRGSPHVIIKERESSFIPGEVSEKIHCGAAPPSADTRQAGLVPWLVSAIRISRCAVCV